MAIRFMEGFEVALDEPYFTRLYQTVSGTLDGTPNPTGRETGSAARSSSTGDLELTTPLLVASPDNTWFTNIAVKFVDTIGLATGTTVFPGLTIMRGASEQITIDFIPDNRDCGNFIKIRVARGGTVLGTTTLAMASTYWHYLEIKAVLRTGVNGSVEIKVSQQNNTTVQWLNLTGINTANSGSDGADTFRLRWSGNDTSGGHIDYDDWIIYDTTGGVNDTFLGPTTIIGMIPSGTGNTMNWTLDGGATSIADAWDDPYNAQSVADDDRRVTSDTVGLVALAALPNNAYLGSTTVRGIMVRTTMGMDSTGTRTIKHYLRNTVLPGETEGTKSFVVSSTSYVGNYEVFDVDPNTAGAFNTASLNGLETGVKMTA